VLFRTRVTTICLVVATASTALLLFYVYMPGALEELLAGEMGGETLTDANVFQLAGFVIFPLMMAVLVLLVGHRVNRWANLIAGATSGIFCVFAVVGHIRDDGLNAHVLLAAVGGTGAFLIAGLSLAAARNRNSEPATPASESGTSHEAAVA
jgi:hypothetical protein